MEQMHEEVGADGLGASIRLVGIEVTRMRDHPANLDSSDFRKRIRETRLRNLVARPAASSTHHFDVCLDVLLICLGVLIFLRLLMRLRFGGRRDGNLLHVTR